MLLLIEVADTSLSYDREIKLPLYARAGIPEVCIVDLEGGRIEHHTTPTGDLYRRAELAGRGETLGSDGLVGTNLRVDDVLG